MRLKLKEFVLSLTLLCFGIFLYGCLEEPTIDPVKTPFSEIRVLNLSQNVNNMTVRIDGAQPIGTLSSMAIPFSTDYFIVKSGSREFSILNEAGTEIFKKKIEITSYDRELIIFTGYYSDDPLLNTFAEIKISEGYAYSISTPAPGTSNLYIVNSIAPYDTVDANEYFKVTARFPGMSTDTILISNLDVDAGKRMQAGTIAPEEIFSMDSLYPGTYSFKFFSQAKVKTLNSAGADSTYTRKDTITYSLTNDLPSNKRLYLFIHGVPYNAQIWENVIDPPAPKPY